MVASHLRILAEVPLVTIQEEWPMSVLKLNFIVELYE